MPDLRTALFIDYENLASALKRKLSSSEDSGVSSAVPRLDFERLVKAIQNHYGNLDPEDVFVVGDFRKHTRQSTGLSRLAHLVDINAYEGRGGRSAEAHRAGVKALARNASNLLLAYYIGVHVARRPALVYLILSGDSALAAVADELLRIDKQVTFIIPGDEPSAVLAERFNCIPFSELHPLEPAGQADETAEALVEIPSAPRDEITDILATLHREFAGSGIPSILLRLALGSPEAPRIISRARNQNLIDIWKDPSGVECVSLHQMRLGGKAVILPARPALRKAAQVLTEIAAAAESARKAWTRADWRKLIKEAGGFSNDEAKRWLEMLLETGILRDAALNRPDFRLEKLIRFLHKAEAD